MAFDPSSAKPLEPVDTGFSGAIGAGLRKTGRGLRETAQMAMGVPVEEEAPAGGTLAEQPVAWGDVLHPKALLEKTAYNLASSGPVIAGGELGGELGGAAGAMIPVLGETGLGELGGGILGAGAGAYAGSMVQTLGPYYAAALKETPQDPDGALDRALQRASVEGAVGGVGYGLFKLMPFKSAVKNMLFQAFGVQPAAAVAGHAVQNVAEDRPAQEGAFDDIPGAVVGTLVPAAGHAILSRGIRAIRGTPAETPPPGTPGTPEPPTPPGPPGKPPDLTSELTSRALSAAAAEAKDVDPEGAAVMADEAEIQAKNNPNLTPEQREAQVAESNIVRFPGQVAEEGQAETQPAPGVEPPAGTVPPKPAPQAEEGELLGDGQAIGIAPKDPVKLRAVADKVLPIIDKMFPGAATKFYDALRATEATGQAGEGHGFFFAHTEAGQVIARVIHLALTEADGEGGRTDRSLPDIVGTARHEGIHYLRSAGILDEGQWATLEQAAKDGGWVTDKIRRDYPTLNEAQLTEEAIAEQFAYWKRGERGQPAGVKGIFYKLGLFLRRVGSATRQVFGGKATADDIFHRIETGDIGQQEPAKARTEASAAEGTPTAPGAAEAPGGAFQRARDEPEGDGTRGAPVKFRSEGDLDAARGRIDKDPTEGQKKAGNYAKLHTDVQGVPVAIENGKGSVRRGVDADGKPWEATLPADYGYIKRTEGADGDHVDTYVGPNPKSDKAFVVDQKHLDGGFDEHKAMLGYDSAAQAVEDYKRAFSDGRGADRIQAVHEMKMDGFKRWLKEGDTKTSVLQQLEARQKGSSEFHDLTAQHQAAARHLDEARKQGYDVETPWYVGSPTGGQMLESGAIDRNRMDPRGLYGPAAYVTNEPSEASYYAKAGVTGQRVPVAEPQPRSFRVAPRLRDALRTMQIYKPNEIQSKFGLATNQSMNGEEIYHQLTSAAGGDKAAVNRYLQQRGIDGVYHTRNNLAIGQRTRNLAVFDPANLRRIDAGFDPEKAGQNGLMFQRASTPEARREERLRKLVAQTPGLRGVMKYLQPDEIAKLKRNTARQIVDIFSNLPSPEEMAAVAYSGRAKRGWYQKSADALVNVFGEKDAPRFAALLAAMSPQTSVENNAINALRTWVSWDKAGRPTGAKSIVKIMGQNVQGNKGEGSILGAWKNNAIAALSKEDPRGVVLSGPKVNSFMLNLRHFVNEVTNDAWMANYANIDQEVFRKTGPTPGKGAGYVAMSARARKAAEILTKKTGDTWTPAEVQETVWSWAKTLYEKASNDRTARQLLKAADLTHEEIGGTPDFAGLFANKIYAKILAEGGYGVEKTQAGGERPDGSPALTGPAVGAEGSGIAPDAFARHLDRAARRLDQRRVERRDQPERNAAFQRAPGDAGAGGRGGGESLRQAQEAADEAGGGEEPLKGLPQKPIVLRDGSTYVPGPLKIAHDAARDYMKSAGLPYDPPKTYAKVDEERAGRIAQAYDAMKHDPHDRKVKQAYDAMISETTAQYEALMKSGLKVEFIPPGSDDPYAGNPRAATKDVRDNNHLWVFSTRDGFGSDATFDASENPLLQGTKHQISSQPALANDLFRVVHDYFGHIKDGNGFRAGGEENAWRSHAAMYSPEARRAMTSETRGQNSWVNYGPHGEKNRTASASDTTYADQKIGLLPKWVSEDGAGDEDQNAATRRMFGSTGRVPVGQMLDVANSTADRSTKGKQVAAAIAARRAAPDQGYKKRDLSHTLDDLQLKHDVLRRAPVANDRGKFQRAANEEKAKPFFSQLTRQVENLKLAKAHPSQWLGTLEGLKGKGVKEEEMAWSGVRDWLKDQKGLITKDQVLDHLRENEVQIQEVTKGSGAPDTEAAAERWLRDQGHNIDEIRRSYGNDANALRDAAHDNGRRFDEKTKFGSWTIPGGENYREMLLTLPDRGPDHDAVATAKRRAADANQALRNASEIYGRDSGAWHAALTEKQIADRELEDLTEKWGENFTAGHFDEPNILAHVRMNDRTGPNGEKILHVEEIQSDWHQQGRRQGYRTPVKVDLEGLAGEMGGDFAHDLQLYHQDMEDPKITDNAEIDAVLARGHALEARATDLAHKHGLPDNYVVRIDSRASDGYDWVTVKRDPDGTGITAERGRTPYEAVKRTVGAVAEGGVPNAPFKSSWHELALKRVLRHAAENGYDKVTWTTGDQQAERYNLSKKISRVEWTRGGTSGFSSLADIEHRWEDVPVQGVITAWDHDGNKVIEHVAEEKDLPNLIGKEAAEKLLNQEPARAVRSGTALSVRKLVGLDLNVGGEGMKGFYDKMLPASGNKIGKPFGAKVEKGEIGASESGLKYEGPEPTQEQIEALRDAVSAPPTDQRFVSPITGEQQLFMLNRASMQQALDRVEHDMFIADVPFAEAMETHGTPELAKAFGGKMVQNERAQSLPVHSMDITPPMRQHAVEQGFPMFQRAEGGEEEKKPFLRTPKGVELRDIRLEKTALGAQTVRGTLWPSGEKFSATLNAVSGRPGASSPDKTEQVVYTDRGALKTGMNVYDFAKKVDVAFQRAQAPAGQPPRTQADRDILDRAATMAKGSMIGQLARRLITPGAFDAFAKGAAAMITKTHGEAYVHSMQVREKMKEIREAVQRSSPAERERQAIAVDRGDFDSLPPDMARLARGLKAETQSETSRLQRLGQRVGQPILADAMENYLGRYWKPRGEEAADNEEDQRRIANRLAVKRPLTGPKSFLKARHYDSWEAARAAGLEPVFDNWVDAHLAKLGEMNRYWAGTVIAHGAKRGGFAQFYTRGAEPKDWHELEGPEFVRMARTIEHDDGTSSFVPRGAYYAPEGFARVMNNYQSKGLESTLWRDPVNAWRKVGNAMNSLQLGFSLFHPVFTTLDAQISRVGMGIDNALAGRFGKAAAQVFEGLTPLNWVNNVRDGNRLLKAILRPEDAPPEMRRIVDAFGTAGGRVWMERALRSTDEGGIEWWKKGGIGTALRQAVLKYPGGGLTPRVKQMLNIAGRSIESISAPIMDTLVPRQKLGVFSRFAHDWLERNPNHTDADFVRNMQDIWESVDNRLGEMVYDNVFWHKYTKDAAHLLTRSVGWNMGSFREIPVGAAEFGLQAARLATGRFNEAEWTRRMSYVIALPAVTALYGAMYQYLSTGQGPQELKDYFFPKTGMTLKSGQPERVSTPSYMKDVVAWYTHPAQTAQNKTHPMVSMVAQMLSNKDYYGDIIRNYDDPVVKQVEDVLSYAAKELTPFSIQATTKLFKEHPAPQAAMGMLGFNPAPGYIANPQAEEHWEKKQHTADVKKKARDEARREQPSVRPAFASGGGVGDDYNTPLSSDEERSFQAWKQHYAPHDGGADYDLRGAYKAGLTPAANGHWPDTFKKPNHPTFSDESKYSGQGYPGHWEGDTFVPPAPMRRGGAA